MCLAIVYKETEESRVKLCENIAKVEFDGKGTILTDILKRKTEVEGYPKMMDLSGGVILF
ncbi:MAG: CooT family nickel-binding protein [Clostridiales bacterium]|nr:CooT family nickel-binding protein [Clostridiales bacterium]